MKVNFKKNFKLRINFFDLWVIPFVFLFFFLSGVGGFLGEYFPDATATQVLFFVFFPYLGENNMLHIFLRAAVYRPIVYTVLACIICKIFFLYIQRFPNVSGGFTNWWKEKFYKAGYVKSMIVLFLGLSFFVFVYDFSFVCRWFLKGTSQFYEKHFVFPEMENIDIAKKKNIILIYAESLENTFENIDFYGENLMPELEELEKEGVQFTEYRDGYGTDFSIGSLVALYLGMPSYIIRRELLNPGITLLTIKEYNSLGKVLKHWGYQTLTITPADSRVSGLNYILKNNGIDNIIDQFDMLKMYPERKLHDWGVDDVVTMEILKNKVIEFAGEDKPFFIHTFTIDTHSRYIPYMPECTASQTICENPYKTLIWHSSKLIADFIRWFKTQPAYKDTVIIIVGDHLRMHDTLKKPKRKQRTVYNLFLNTGLKPENVNRKFTQIDLFPTILEAAGAKIKNHRLGLGTSVFGNEKTLAEIYSEEYLNNEMSKKNKLQETLWVHER